VSNPHIVFIGLGSNLGERLANLEAAVRSLPPAVQLRRRSPVYETAPWGFQEQPDFLNQVVQAETHLSPLELLTHLKSIEATLGRVPTFRNGPRTIDLDILLYDRLVLELPDLTLPHPRLSERAFVLYPLADLAPDLRHPASGKSVRQMLGEVDPSGIHLYQPE
jgi:2-amino-4-hydroxy-6-hydroxymethyldihydropteridine diphosphokinase